MLSVRTRSESSFLHSLVKMEPAAASQVKLTEFPSIDRFVDDVTAAPDILSVEKKIIDFG